MNTVLTEREQALALSIARETICSVVRDGTLPDYTVTEEPLLSRQGCFVTIKKNNRLRGCIGNFVSDIPLYRLIQEMAVAAATKDPRFYPMKHDDLADFTLEISVLSPLHQITSIEEIEVGTHGLYIEKNFHHGVLLPQVAPEYGWDRETFLTQTCIKAGLLKDDWKDGATISIFSAQVFGES